MLSGAFVAGNDAGRAYNTWPKMGDDWVPEEVYNNEEGLVPAWRNIFENTATVQFDHRLLATTAATASVATALFGRRVHGGALWALLPPPARSALTAGGAVACAQASLGVATLLLYVPTGLAATHQLGSLVLLTCWIAGAHSLRCVAILSPAAAAAAAAASVVATAATAVATTTTTTIEPA